MSPMQSLPLTTTAEKRGNYPLNLRSCDFSCTTEQNNSSPKKTTQSAYSQCCRSSHDYKKLSPDFKSPEQKVSSLRLSQRAGDNETDVPHWPGH